MELHWALEALRVLRSDAKPYVSEIQSDFLKPVVQTNNLRWMSESNNTMYAQAVQHTMMRCEICGGNHLSDYCTFKYNSRWQNHQTFTWQNNESPTYPTEQYYPFYPQQAQEFPHESKPSMEELLMSTAKLNKLAAELNKENAKNMVRLEATVQSQAASLRRLEDQIRQLANNQSYRPQETLSGDAKEDSWISETHKDTTMGTELEPYTETEVPYQDPGACSGQISDTKLKEEIRRYIHKEVAEQGVKREQLCEPIRNLMIKDDTSQHGEASIIDTSHKLDRMTQPVKVKHHTRPLDYPFLHSRPHKDEDLKNVAWALSGKDLYLSPPLWKRRLHSNAHGTVLSRTYKATLKSP